MTKGDNRAKWIAYKRRISYQMLYSLLSLEQSSHSIQYTIVSKTRRLNILSSHNPLVASKVPLHNLVILTPAPAPVHCQALDPPVIPL